MNIAHETDPVAIAAAARRAGLFQDIVIAASRFLHGQDLLNRDRRALRKAAELLALAASSEAVLRHSTTQQLADASATLAVLRAAGPSASEAGYFEDLGAAIAKALRGIRSDPVVRSTRVVQGLFLAVNEATLSASLRGEQEDQSSQLPIPSTANSPS